MIEIVHHTDESTPTTPCLVWPQWDDEALPEDLAGALDPADWHGRRRQTALVYGAGAARRTVLLGLGARAWASLEVLRELAAVATQRVAELRLEHYTVRVPALDGHDAAQVTQAWLEGALLAAYRFDRFKVTTRDNERVALRTIGVIADAAAAPGIAAARAIVDGVVLARDLANRPPNDLPPAGLAQAATDIAARRGLSATVYGPDVLRAQGFGGILAVGGGSANEPRFIALEYGSPGPDTPTICLVGKGITFDSGGISIKPADGMDAMKMDMGGAAAVLGAIDAVAALGLPLHVVALVASAENMLSGTAYRPGDIVTALSGSTIEVLNTDAEGRIVLADALSYAQRFRPAAVIDLATLTGAITVALGPHAIGLMGNDDALAARVLAAGERCGERAWQLPLWPAYHEMVKSDVADVRNTGGSRAGGAITAAAFLAHFAGDLPWVHLDIAGTAWTDARPKPYTPRGATGVGVRLLIELLRDWRAG